MKTINNYASLVKEKHALNKTIAPVETDLTDASQAYAIGQNFIYDGVLYKAKTAIAQHDALVLNTNYEAADDIVSQIAGKQDPITVDNVPTENSNNLVKSGGVYSAEQNIYAVMGEMGAKNLIPYPYSKGTTTINGVTYTVNADGSISADSDGVGATDTSIYRLYGFTADTKYITLPAGSYILNGCPAEGGSSSYRIFINRQGDVDTYAIDDGEGATFTLDTATNIGIAIRVAKDYVADEVIIKPMIRLATDANADYQPYAKTNKELTAENQTLTQKAYLTDDATETALASDDVVPFYDTSATAKKKMTVQKMAEQLISNPNLLDNPWFTINQRGLSTYNGTDIYTVDRWKISRNTHNVIVNSDYVSLVRVGSGYNPTFDEKIEGIRPGKYTVSVKYRTTKVSSSDAQSGYKINVGTYLGEWLPTSADWNILSKTVNIPSDFTGNLAINIQDLNASKGTSATDDQIDIACVKIELGEISTLALDTAPNYAEELLKCQRYFIRYSTETANSSIGFFRGFKTNAIVGDVVLPTFMRAQPTVTVNDLTYFRFEGYTNGSTENLIPSSITLSGSSGNVCKLVGVPTTDAVIEKVYSLKFTNILGTLDFSADL